jgi:ketosteroid isomerase-like protein
MADSARGSRTDVGYLRLLREFGDAWNRHDVEALMSAMDVDCVFEASSGPEACGRNYRGYDAVRQAYSDIFKVFPDAAWKGMSHFVSGDKGYSEWLFVGTRAGGERVEVNGCDLFTFRNGKIAVKNSFRKARTL